MSVDIPVSYVEQFSASVHLTAEQRMSRLLGTIRREPVTGESFFIERIGSVTGQQITTLHGDTPLNNTAHSRRMGVPVDYDVADLIDKQSRVRLLIDPDGPYQMRHAGYLGRTIDDLIISALGGSAASGKTGTTLVALPSGQKVASGSTGMTISKILQAKEILDHNEVDEFIPRYAVITSRQIRDLLNDDKVSSADYNTVKALVQGTIDEFLGFKFIRSERLLLSTTDRLCYFYAGLGVGGGFGQEINSVANERPDKRNAKQIYSWMSFGAVRVEDEMVVEVAASEA